MCKKKRPGAVGRARGGNGFGNTIKPLPITSSGVSSSPRRTSPPDRIVGWRVDRFLSVVLLWDTPKN